MIKNVVIIGTGFVADYYIKMSKKYIQFKIIGGIDKNIERAKKFCFYHKIHCFETLEEIINDENIHVVLNLTNPSEHFEISKKMLLANKHVYSEKPLAITFAEATQLYNLAKIRNLVLVSAPCSILSETAQTLWKAVRENVIGKVKLIYAEMDDGMIHLSPYRLWKNDVGVPWPAKDEFEVGCTLEHAGYCVTWLTAMFGSALSVTAFSSCLIENKLTDEPLNKISPDFSVVCIRFNSNIVARLTCSIVAPHEHKLTFIGEQGVMYVNDVWNYYETVKIKKFINIRRKRLMIPWNFSYKMVGKNVNFFRKREAGQMDFARGIAEMIDSINEKRICRLSPEFCLHNTELVLAIHNAREHSNTYNLTTSFLPIEPMLWAVL